mmetsp:Transcript_8700/g.36262  ORF Transcript_8700/g.36262 Transcript_8700/m.36262 type:complete len:201 (-) Transcript_8700:650-1252(-)
MPPTWGKRPSRAGSLLKPFSNASQMCCPLSVMIWTGSLKGRICMRSPIVRLPGPYVVPERSVPPQMMARSAEYSEHMRSQTRLPTLDSFERAASYVTSHTVDVRPSDLAIFLRITSRLCSTIASMEGSGAVLVVTALLVNDTVTPLRARSSRVSPSASSKWRSPSSLPTVGSSGSTTHTSVRSRKSVPELMRGTPLAMAP